MKPWLAPFAAVLFAASSAIAQAPPPGAPPPASPYPPNVQAGGLTPPPPSPAPPPAPGPTERELDKGKKEDSKRGLEWFWIQAEGGVSYVGLQTFVANEKNFTVGFVPTEATGAMAGAALGLRLIFLTIGARGRVGFYDAWNMFQVGGEIGLHIPLGRVEPHFFIGGGYSALGNINAVANNSANAISVQGGYARAGVGLDIYIAPIFSIGLQASGDFMAMVRPGLSLDEINKIKADPNISDAKKALADGLGLEGSSYGLGITGTGVIGLHF